MACVHLISMGNLGSRLKLIRERRGLSQLALSYKSGISQPSIARIEAGHQKNLKTETIEKLAASLEISLSHLLEEPLMISEDVSSYEAIRRIPVISLQEFIASGCRLLTEDRHGRFEPSLSTDISALFLSSCSVLGSDVEKGDLLLIEPSSKINNNDTVLYISKDRQCIGRIYYHSSAWIIQPLKSASEPVFYLPTMRKNRDTKLFKVAELRKKM